MRSRHPTGILKREKLSMILREAKKEDVKHLVALEQDSFDYDQLSSRQFNYFLNHAHGKILVLEVKKEIVGYGILLYHKSTALVRLYSLAISSRHRGNGYGKKLLQRIEHVAEESGHTFLRLEVKSSNEAAISLYKSCGYRQFSYKKGYYTDKSDAICLEKQIRHLKTRKLIKGPVVPYYHQTTEFTCGPSALLMAMNALNKKIKLTQENEIDIWREATTIFMTSGHGGCGPHGLALAAHNRGFEVEIYVNTKATLFLEGVRSSFKKEIIDLVQKTFEKKIKRNKIKSFINEYDWETIKTIFRYGGIPILLISAYRLTESKAPHWIALTAIESEFVYFHDPEIDDDETKWHNMNVPVRRDEFESMAKFGSRQLKSIVAIYPKSE